MNWLPVIVLFTIFIVTFIPVPKKEEANDSLLANLILKLSPTSLHRAHPVFS